jgi:thiol:disulfide interchange protein DsbD
MAMKKIIVICLILVSALQVNAQKLNPVKWTFEAVKVSDKQYDIVFTANVDAPWHIYSQFVAKGPVPTKIVFKKNALVQLKGKAKEIGKLEKHFDKNFGAEIAYFSNKVQFVQTVNLRAASKTSLSGEVEYMVCNDERCLPPTKIPFEVAVQ